MQFIKKIFGKKKKGLETASKSTSSVDKSQLDVDELFVVNFKENGGKFFYPADIDELKTQLELLLKIEGEDKYAVVERSYLHFLKKLKISVTDDLSNSKILLLGCEYLLASEGAVLFTSQHLKNTAKQQSKYKRVILATSDQIVMDKQQAMQEINKKYDEYPSNIQSFSNFKISEENTSDAPKTNTFLFLIEK